MWTEVGEERLDGELPGTTLSRETEEKGDGLCVGGSVLVKIERVALGEYIEVGEGRPEEEPAPTTPSLDKEGVDVKELWGRE